MHRLGIEFISVFGMPPVEFVGLAADLGCETISLGVTPPDCNPHGYPSYSLRDPALRREFPAALRDRGVSLALAEGFFVLPGHDVSAYAADLDLMCEFGAERINTLCRDPDLARGFDQLGALVEMAAGRGVETVLEFVPTLPVGDLATAAAAVRHVGCPEFGVLVDTMHLLRSGGGPAELAALDPALIAYAQLCDVPRQRSDMSYAHEAKYERMVPGEGELPLLEVLAALPRDLVIGLEIPQRSLAEAGVTPYERLGRCVTAARALLARLDA